MGDKKKRKKKKKEASTNILQRHNYFEFSNDMERVYRCMTTEGFKTISQFLRAAREEYLTKREY